MSVPFPVSLQAFKSSNFAPAFFFLPSSQRRGLKAVYAFCREVDDVVDHGGDPSEARETLETWRELLRNPRAAEARGRANPDVWAALRETLKDYPVDPRHLLDLIDGVERDLTFRRYATFGELETYCHGVASTVGLACLPLFGLDEPGHHEFAVSLGLAVQLTNILRDVRTDGARGRIYLPQEDLARFHYSENDLLRSVYDDRFVRLMRFEAARAETLYARALESLPPMSRPAARPALVMGKVYRTLLAKMEKAQFNVFPRQVTLTRWEKLRCVWQVLRGI